MKISKIGEFGLIERIKKTLNNPDIGSDCAPVVIGSSTYLVTCDILIEDRHFLRGYPPQMVGFKAIAVNASDIVASGGRPESALISLTLPDIEVSYVDQLYKGIITACKAYGCKIIGGNIARSDKIAIDVFMIGKTDKFIKRKTAKVGDRIFVTGFLGDSKAGLELLLKNKTPLEPFEKILVRRHLRPEIKINISDYLVKNASSSMDLSDGLSSDINQLFDKKRVRIMIDSNKIPVSKELYKFCKKYHYDAISYAMSGGEDYKILFTQKKKDSPFFEIGHIEKGTGIYVDDKKFDRTSFDHFNP
jgi:thiamine-monophosphate kinase